MNDLPSGCAQLTLVAVVVGTDADPQDVAEQIEVLQGAGAMVHPSNTTVVRYAGELAQALSQVAEETHEEPFTAVDLDIMKQPLAAINVGLESFVESLKAQNAAAIHVDWQPPASGNEKLMDILARMKSE